MKKLFLLCALLSAAAFGQSTPGVLNGPNVISCTQATCSVSAVNIIASASNVMYTAYISVACTTATATATATITVAYTDPSSTAQSITPSSVATCTTLGSASVATITQAFTAKSGTAITYATTIANAPAGYQGRVVITQQTTN